MICPRCNAVMHKVDLPSRDLEIGNCPRCMEVAQKLHDGEVISIGDALEAHARGDDRVRRAISPTKTVPTLSSFIDLVEAQDRLYQFDRAALSGQLRVLLTQIENRLAGGISHLRSFEFVSDEAVKGLALLREAQTMVSPLAVRTRGVPGRGDV